MGMYISKDSCMAYAVYEGFRSFFFCSFLGVYLVMSQHFYMLNRV